MLKNEILKKKLKNNKKKLTWVNLLNQWPNSWDLDNLIESKQTKWPESTRINLSNMRSRSWNYDNPIKNESKQIMKLNSQPTQCWRVKLKNKLSIKKKLESTYQTRDTSYETELIMYKKTTIIMNPNIQ